METVSPTTVGTAFDGRGACRYNSPSGATHIHLPSWEVREFMERVDAFLRKDGGELLDWISTTEGDTDMWQLFRDARHYIEALLVKADPDVETASWRDKGYRTVSIPKQVYEICVTALYRIRRVRYRLHILVESNDTFSQDPQLDSIIADVLRPLYASASTCDYDV